MAANSDKNPNPKLIEKENVALLNMQDQTASDKLAFQLDRDWSKHAFLISDSQLSNFNDVKNRYWSSASAKFTDTRMGGNIGINARPQFTRYSDIRDKGRLADRANVSVNSTSGNYGMGRYYSEAIDDPSQTIYMQFGVPQFNSLTNFISKAFDSTQLTLARTGRAPGVFYTLARLVTTAIPVVMFPSLSVTIMAGRAISYFFQRPTSKFYTMKPTMNNYWMTVSILVNSIAVNKGIFPKILNSEADQDIGKPYKIDEDYLTELSAMMPDIFGGQFHFDMYAIANKAQRLANQMYEDDYQRLNQGTATDFTGIIKKDLTGTATRLTKISNRNSVETFISRIDRLTKLKTYFGDEGENQLEVDPRIDSKDPEGKERKDKNYFQEIIEHFDADFRQGSQFAVFKVDNTGPVSESFGNSVVESSLSQKLNSISSDNREARFSFSEGNIVGGVVGDVVSGVTGAVKDVVMGALDGVSLGGLASSLGGLAGSGFIDIPKHWQSSTANLPKISYTMQLISPYGNPISQMQNIYIPLAMILAGTLPLSAGKQSYTSPFLCQVYDRGRSQSRLAMIDSLSITRGTSNLPFNIKGSPLAIDVSFSIVDLSSIMHMPVSSGVLGFGADMGIDEDNILCDYLAVLAGQDIYTQIYAMPKAKLALAKLLVNVNTLVSPAHMSAMFHDSATSGMMQYLTLGAFNALEGVARGAEVVQR